MRLGGTIATKAVQPWQAHDVEEASWLLSTRYPKSEQPMGGPAARTIEGQLQDENWRFQRLAVAEKG